MPRTGLPDVTDDELLNRAQAGDQDSFAELMNRTSSSSMKLALSILKDRSEAEDEVQNSYWNAWRYVGQFQRGSKFSTWISRIVINQCLMRLRKLRKTNYLYLDEPSPGGDSVRLELNDQGPTPEAVVRQSETNAILHREIGRLPPLLRHVLVLRDVDELPMDAVAGELGISTLAAKSRLLRARAELRTRLEKHLGARKSTVVPA